MKNPITFFLLLLITFMFISCRRDNNDQKPITIRWWHINSDKPSQLVLEDIARSFEKNNPHVKVKVTMLDNMEYKPKLELEFAAGDPPDIFHSWGGGGMREQAHNGYLRDITDWVESDRWESKINPVALNLYRYKGRVYGFPHDLGSVGFWYNENLLKKAGYSKFPETWDEFYRLCDKLKSLGITPISLGIADRWTVMYYWVYLTLRIGGADLFYDIHEGKRNFNDPALIEAGSVMQALFKRDYFQPTAIGDDFINQSRHVGDGICAMQLMGQWAVAVQAQTAEKKDALSDAMMFAPFPELRGKKGSIHDAMGGGNGFVIGSTAPDEAIELLEYFTRAENLQKYFNVFSAIPTVEEVVIKHRGQIRVKSYLKTMNNYCLYPDQLFPLEIGNLLNETSARIMLGELTSKQGCELLDKAWKSY
ncbi:MAG: extracellular solute-binding protein [Spirochaetes bacterium]|jgi:raffinose/stachyose/melibiose transport system substrate-binding protein|nr:extracellular solute-binding protein [Spirochaetota bacterium]